MAFGIGQAAFRVLLPRVASESPLLGLSDAQIHSASITLVALGEIAGACLLAVRPLQRIGLRLCTPQALAGAAMLAIALGHPVCTATPPHPTD